MKQLRDFVPFVASDVLGCPDPTVQQAVLQSAIEFCERSLIVLQWARASTASGRSEYVIPLPQYLSVAKVHYAWFKNTKLRNLTAHLVASPTGPAPSLPSLADVGDPQYAVQLSNGRLSVHPTPAVGESGSLAILVSVKPARDASEVDDVLFDDWADGVSYGAKSRLLMARGQPYSDQKLGMYWLTRFNQEVARARREHERGLLKAQFAFNVGA